MKTLYLIRGLPGSGKTTLAKKMAIEKNCKHFETDMYFVGEDGVYRFDIKMLQKGHAWCQSMVYGEMQKGNDVIVSNTFTTVWEMTPYILQATLNNFNVAITECCGKYQNVHDVPEKSLLNMSNRWVPNSDLCKMEGFTDDWISFMSYGDWHVSV